MNPRIRRTIPMIKRPRELLNGSTDVGDEGAVRAYAVVSSAFGERLTGWTPRPQYEQNFESSASCLPQFLQNIGLEHLACCIKHIGSLWLVA